MAVPTYLQPQPHKLRKGETVVSVLKSKGFPAKAADWVFGLDANRKLRTDKGYKSHTELQPGDVIHVPVLTKDQIHLIIEMMMKLQFEASSLVRADDFQQRVYDTEDAINKANAQLEQIWRSMPPAGQALRNSAEECKKKLYRSPAWNDVVKCMTEIEKWGKERQKLDKDTLSRVNQLESTLRKAQSELSSAQTVLQRLTQIATNIEKHAQSVENTLRPFASSKF
ncbi:hypothetical protein [Seohaeicola zhoushanensis]|uniref:Uncharacterized protein n=1 Tax=Seohaeicola zhoushanensis TaxID=1569283 RepID=A0A8J3M4V5_9RHOB|nr:hypothetical protein [Seohaeicola zhoushanensis]GHF40423.1 hypothetical protein GCM10017056_09970 [Seohaeicola zhoushanensis]